ncbi:hypothetical protein [Pseudomonas sp. S09G 359]|jgi:hypothetical protein|uniref:hypothetical protein n=1 Tax=Pseudomonas sp. S09G 359 TaxID=2054919 RepID=UPI000C6E307D|nr:hypothetical protein [Pseudomonas sp. S09G 359]AUG06227.1 hypothetical protein CXQ82_06370 [Pseudomonas sp. S09G 359]
MIGGTGGIGALEKMMEMAQGFAKLGQGAAQGEEGAQGAGKQGKADPLKLLMDMLSAGNGGADGGSEGQMDAETLEKKIAGREGLEAMMPKMDTRKIEV